MARSTGCATTLLDRCAGEGGELLTALAQARGACRLRFLTGAATVCYGVPVTTLPRGVSEGEGVEEPRARAKR